jgi:hypothetical protein
MLPLQSALKGSVLEGEEKLREWIWLKLFWVCFKSFFSKVFGNLKLNFHLCIRF